MLIFLTIIVILIIIVFAFLQQAGFGQLPRGTRLEKIKQSSNYQNGKFQNMSHTPDLTEGVGYYTVAKEFLFAKKTRVRPAGPLPSVKTDLLKLDLTKDVLVWFGHSSYFIQIDGKRILVGPVLSGSASPVPFGAKAFKGADIYTAADIPSIDYLFISHDHWDHLDYETIKKLKPKIKTVICGLGTGAHFERWGYDNNKVIERDWNEKIVLEDGFTAYTAPARHFSGRGLARNKSLWVSYVLQTPTMRIFIGGDSGYDRHFLEIGKAFGPFDLAVIENGQYDRNWRYIHLLPNEVLQAAKDLNAKRILPVHSAKFVLGNHPWDEPLELITKNKEAKNLNLITPMIGEQVNLKDENQTFTKWWRNLNA